MTVISPVLAPPAEDYLAFLQRKAAISSESGFAVDDDQVHPILKPHQRDIVRWCVRGGRRAIFAAFGLGKSVMQLDTLRLVLARTGGRALIVCPLGVRQEFVRDAAMLGIEVRFVRWTADVDGPGIYLTNYESVRDGRLDPALFTAVSLDEASVLRSFGSKTYQTFLTLFDQVPYRFVATATPSPNRYKELIHYAGYLGVMDTGQALTRFFQRDSTKANNLTLYPHKTVEFRLWLHSWAVFLQRPSDICRCPCHESTSTSRASGSVASSLSNGDLAPGAPAGGSVDATAETSGSHPRTTSGKGEREAADAYALVMAARGVEPSLSGKASSPVAPTRTTRTGPTTEAGASPSANAGGTPSARSETTWEARPSGAPSNASTMTAATSPATAGGPPAESKPGTPAGRVSLPTPAASNPSPHGLTNSARTTSPSTPASSSSVGRPSAPSPICCRDCRCDDGYDLPELEIVYHEVATDHSDAPVDRDGQAPLFKGAALGVSEAAREKRDTLTARVEQAMEIVSGYVDRDPDPRGGARDQVIIWCDLNAEQDALERALDDLGLTYSSIHGALSLEEAERRLTQWRARETYALIGKPVMLGQGMNLQQCNKAIYVGITFKFNDLIQSLHRIQRFGQARPCRAHIIHAESEREVVRTLREKWAQHKELTANMSAVIREHGLNRASIAEALTRSLGVDRVEASGEGWLVANNDCVDEVRRMEDSSVDLIVTSIPFANHYEYTPSYNDFGHTDDNDHFWSQMDYLTPQLLRVLRPGRIYACHVKDRILFGNVTGAGVPTVSPFHAEALMHGRRHGFDYLGMITVVTDVVRENNQTYRLGWTEQCKDATKMGVGSPEYILLFHKPQTDRTRGYADTPVVKSKAQYSRARWQVDAHAFWRSDGNRPLTPDELGALPPEQMSRLFTEQTLREVYDYESHVRIGEVLDGRGVLPATFMSLAPGSWHPEVWHDVNRMLTLNTEQSRRAQAMHVCPLQFDIVDRLINRFSNPDELVFDPFGGLFTVPVRALRAGRRGRAVELNSGYFLDGVKYLQAEERRVGMPSLFDLDGAA